MMEEASKYLENMSELLKHQIEKFEATYPCTHITKIQISTDSSGDLEVRVLATIIF